MYCLKCGKELNDTAAFCPACGTSCSPKSESPVSASIPPKVQSGATSVLTDSRQCKKKSTIFKIVIPVMAAILVLVALSSIVPKLIPASDPKAPNDNDAVINESSEAANNESSEVAETSSVSYDDLQANLEEAYTAVETAWTQESNIDTGTDKGNLE
ncbi:MAG: zinc-ribbon domain-containing protein, partial [Lachnospiraceae bacterium]